MGEEETGLAGGILSVGLAPSQGDKAIPSTRQEAGCASLPALTAVLT